jgi:hypothetical protein
MFSIKMQIQLVTILEKLQRLSQLLTNKALKMLLMQMLVQLRQIIKSLRLTKLTHGMTLISPSTPRRLSPSTHITILIMLLELIGCESRKTTDEISLVLNAQFT